MRKRVIIGVVSAGVLLLGAIGSGDSQPQPQSLNTASPAEVKSVAKEIAEPAKPTCDGTSVTTSCIADGITYATYIYHPAVPEKYHTETVTTYEQEVTGYCTLCSDGTYSPSCATGRGACSHHGGVAQWNAPRYASVPKHSSRTVVDAPARDAYYEKIIE